MPGIQAQDILFWDDSPGNVVAARAAGLHAERYSIFADFKQKLSRYLGEEYREVLAERFGIVI